MAQPPGVGTGQGQNTAPGQNNTTTQAAGGNGNGNGNAGGGAPIAQSGAVTEDQGVVGGFLTVSGDADFTVGNDIGKWTADTISGLYGDLVIDADGVWSYSADNTQGAIQALDTGDTLVEVFTINSTKGPTTVTVTINGADEPPCFTRGTLVDTPQGPRAVEDLQVGDAVLTADHGVQALRWIGSKQIDLRGAPLDAPLRPIRFRAGSIAPGVPSQDTLVSPMHRVVLGGAQAQLLFGHDEVLAAAKHLVNGQTIFADQMPEVEYFHLLFDTHEIVTTHGMQSESFYPGDVGLTGFEDEIREEVLALFPELRSSGDAYGPTARDVLKRYEAGLLTKSMRPSPELRDILDARAA